MPGELTRKGQAMTDATERLTEILRAEARVADGKQEQDGELLRRLSDTTANMTPAERTWVQEASEQELRGLSRRSVLAARPTRRAQAMGEGSGVRVEGRHYP